MLYLNCDIKLGLQPPRRRHLSYCLLLCPYVAWPGQLARYWSWLSRLHWLWWGLLLPEHKMRHLYFLIFLHHTGKGPGGTPPNGPVVTYFDPLLHICSRHFIIFWLASLTFNINYINIISLHLSEFTWQYLSFFCS